VSGAPRPRRPPPEDIEDGDPGLARERTKLAWTRSSISFAAIGVLIGKTRPLIGAPLLILSAIIWSIGLVRRTPGQAGVAAKRVLFVMICVLVIAAVALTVALTAHSPHGLRLSRYGAIRRQLLFDAGLRPRSVGT
jgi:hypothetical protein